MTRSNSSECFILFFYCASMVVYLGVILEYKGIFVILIDDNLVINIKCNLNRWRHRRGEGSSNRTIGEGEVHLRREDGTSNHATGEGRGVQTIPPERGGGLDLRRWENIAATLSVNYCNYFNIFTPNNTPTNEELVSAW
jgi:hypothetical protein